MGGSPNRNSGKAYGFAANTSMPQPKGQQMLSAMAKEQGKPDPFASSVAPAAAPAAPDPMPTPEPAQATGANGIMSPAVGAQPPQAAIPGVAQPMVNATPARAGMGGYGSVPAANPVSVPVAAPQAAVLKPAVAAAAQANQTTTGANQFTAPSMNGITFGGS
ncbi:MAG: hypothetical protein EBY21_11730 [Alphaproteobacteria bacterium]|nr:hypothetical protein [Alphaproteobacteria bacterium]